MIKKFWNKVSFLGLEDKDQDTAVFQYREVILINRLIVMFETILLLYLPIEIIFNGISLLYIILTEMFIGGLTLLWNRFKKFTIAKIYFFITTILSIAPLMLFIPREAGNQYFLLPVSLIPLLLFKKNWQAVTGFLFVVFIYFVVDLTRDNVENILDLPLETLSLFSRVFIFMDFLILYFTLYYFKQINGENEKIIYRQHDQLKNSHDVISEKNKEITDSITYAKRIQSAILPPESLINKSLPENFILYIPKDIVAGDFYWFEAPLNPPKGGEQTPLPSERAGESPPPTGELEGACYFAAADCTGHGVPGAMVSVVCHNALNRSVREFGNTEPSKILDKTRDLVIETFEKSEEEVKDGMDISLCRLTLSAPGEAGGALLQWAGANNPLWIINPDRKEWPEEAIPFGEGNGGTEIKPDKQPIGKCENPVPYTNHTITLQKGDTCYIFTDGFADQFGGARGKKFKGSQFKSLLLSIQEKSMEEQKQILTTAINEWKSDLEQVDDICIIGVRL